RGDVLSVQRLAPVGDVALEPGAGDEVVQAVERPEDGGLAAPGRADEGGDLVLVDGQGDVGDGLEGAVPDRDVLHGEDDLAARGWRLLLSRPLGLPQRG